MAPASTGGEWPRLEQPPIIEVVCGVFFTATPEIDPVFVGGLLRDLSTEYTRHQIHPAVVDAPGTLFAAGVPPLRCWLISPTDEWVLQFQADRFYVNWRRRGNDYPRFSSGGGGVLDRTLTEIDRFRRFCRERLRKDVEPLAVELAKVDLIAQGAHWTDVDDLARVMPLIGDLSKFAKSPNLELGLNIADRDPSGIARVVGLSLSTETLPDGRLSPAVKIETRCTAGLASRDPQALRQGFEKLNATANAAFFGLINQAELARFKKKG